jgi:hypothetical protein
VRAHIEKRANPNARRQRSAFDRYPHVTIQPHDMISERLLRVIALGRKNPLFVGHA